MRITRVAYEDFLSFRNTEIDFTDLSYAAIVGRNGSGKSSILQGIPWAIYGTTRVAGDNDGVVNDEADSCTVTVELDDRDGAPWRIVRTRVRGKKGVLRLYGKNPSGEWVALGDHLNATAQTKIDEIVGMNEEVFYSLVLMDQSSSAGGTRFTRADSNTRRRILTSLLPELDVYDSYENAAREANREVGADVARYTERIASLDTSLGELRGVDLPPLPDSDEPRRREGRIDELTADIATANEPELRTRHGVIAKKLGVLARRITELSSDRDSLESELSAAEAAHEANLDRIDVSIREARRRVRDFGRLTERREDAEARLEKAQDERPKRTAVKAAEAAVEEARNRLDALAETRDRVAEKRERRRAEVDALGAEIDEITERLNSLDRTDTDGACWACGTHLSETTHDRIVNDLTTKSTELAESLRVAERALRALEDRMEENTADRRSANADLDTAERQVTRIERDTASARAAEHELRSLLTEIEEELAEYPEARDLDDRVESLEEQRDQSERTYRSEVRASIEARLAELPDSDAAAQIEDDIDDLEEERDEIEDDLRDVAKLQGSLAEAEKYAASLDAEIAEVTAMLGAARLRASTLEKLVDALGPKGVRSMLLDSVLSSIEVEQNAILDSLPGTDGMRMEFRQTRDLKSREGTKDVLDIIVHTADGHARPIESFSFGERVRLTMSNLFAMVKVFNERTGGLVRTLALDEPLGPLDEESVPAFVEVLLTVIRTGVVERVLVVTHDPRVIEALPERLTVSRGEDGASRVELAA